MKLGDTIRVGDLSHLGAAATLTIVAFADEPSTGLMTVQEVRDACPEDVHRFQIPVAWWSAMERAPRLWAELEANRRQMQRLVDELALWRGPEEPPARVRLFGARAGEAKWREDFWVTPEGDGRRLVVLFLTGTACAPLPAFPLHLDVEDLYAVLRYMRAGKAI